MQCKNCGAIIEENSKFCSYCGTALSKEDAQQNASAIMVVDNFYSIMGRGLVVTGKPTKKLIVGDSITNRRTGISYTIVGIEMFRKMKKEAEPNKECGLLLSGAKSDEFNKNDELI